MATTSSSQDIDLNANSGPSILGAIISTWGVALIVLILRFVARRISRVGYWADDWLVLAAFIFHSVVIGLFVASVIVGAGRHTQVLTKAQYSKIEILFLSGELVFNFAVNLPKLSILAFYWRIFSINPGIKLPVKITGAVVTIWILISTFILVFQCSPPSKLAHPEYPGHCLSKWGVFVGGSIPNLLFDVVILAIPIPFIWKLQMGSRQKVFLIILFFLGGLACISSALRLWAFATRDYTSDDLTWTATDPIIWSCTEAAMAIIAACVLSLRPIVTYVRTGSATPTTSAEKSFTRARLINSSSGKRSSTNATAHSFTQTTLTDRELESALGDGGFTRDDATRRPKPRAEPRIEPNGSSNPNRRQNYEWIGWDKQCPVHGENAPRAPEASHEAAPNLTRTHTEDRTQHPSDSDDTPAESSSRQQYEWVSWDRNCPVHHDGPSEEHHDHDRQIRQTVSRQKSRELAVPMAVSDGRQHMTALPSLGPDPGLGTFYIDDESP